MICTSVYIRHGIRRRASPINLFLISTLMASAVITLLLLSAAVAASAAPDMSIISYDEGHGAHSSWRSDEEVRQLHRQWMAKHRRSYGALGEAESRFQVFKDNLRFIDEHNAAADRGEHTYRLGLTAFTDLTYGEFRATYTGGLLTPKNLSAIVASERYRPVDGLSVPASVDWRDSGAVAPIRNQGTCGSCWAFSSISTVESINQIVDGDLIHLSEQELVDCDNLNGGCRGGLMDKAFQFIIRNKGIDSRSDYPYTGQAGICNVVKVQRKVTSIDGYEFVPSRDENALKNAVANQPVTVAISTRGSRELQHYESGIFNGPCPRRIDHAVVAIGYGSNNGKDYWLVRNSWGTNWGEDGYIRMERNVGSREGTCSIATYCVYPTKKSKVSYSTNDSGEDGKSSA